MRNQMKRTIARVLAMSLTISLMATSADVEAAKERIELSKKAITVGIGKSQIVKIKNVKANKIKKLTVKSTKKKIATVKKVGNKKTAFKVTGKKKGSAKVHVTLRLKGQKKSQKLTLKVNVIKVTKAQNAQSPEEEQESEIESPEEELESETESPETTAKSTEIPKVSVAPTVVPETAEPAGETKDPLASALPTATPMVSAIPTTEPAVLPTLKPTGTPVTTPTITATSTPASGVKAGVKIDNVMVTENRTLLVTFSESCTMTEEDIVIKTKNTEQESYGEALAIASIEQVDPYQYQVELDTTSGNYIVNNGYAQVSVASLSGTPLVAEDQHEKEKATFKREWISCFTLGSSSSYNARMNLYNEDFIGALQYKVQGDLPSGLSYYLLGKDLYLRGTPTEVGTFQWVLSVTDEVGKTIAYDYTCLVGDAEHFYASAYSDSEMVGTKLEAYVTASGGSGSYTYTKVEGEYDFTVSESGKVTAEFEDAGTYKVYVDVADAENANLKTRVEVVFVAEATYILGGKVTDLGGSKLEFLGGALDVYMIPQDPQIDEDYFRSVPRATMNSSTSGFSIEVPAGIYDIRFETNYGSVYKVIKGVEVKDQNVDVGTVKLPVCQVTLETPNKDNLYQIYWRDENDLLIGRNASFLVRPGSYTLHSDPDISPVMASLYDFTVTFTATDKTLEKVVTATPRNDLVETMELGKTVEISLSGSPAKYMKFTPKETGKYRFYTTDVDKSMYFGVYSDSEYAPTHHFYLTVSYTSASCSGGSEVNRTTTLYAGTTYYLEFDLSWSDEEDTFTFGMEKVEE